MKPRARLPLPLRMLDEALLPLKLIVPQPIIARLPYLRTNYEIRTAIALEYTKERLLDIGCGENLLASHYRDLGGDAVGVDVYPWNGVDIVVEDSSSLPFEDSSFGTVTLIACLNHIPNREQVLREAHRLLAPGGRVLLTNLTPAISRLWHSYAFWDKDQHERGMKDGEVWGFTERELIDMLSRNDLCVIQKKRFSWRLNTLYVCIPAENA